MKVNWACKIGHTCGQPCTAMGMAAWGCGRDTLTGTAGVSVWTAGTGASTDATCCSASAAEAQQGWFLLNTEVVFTAVINVSLQLRLLSMNVESSANHHYEAGPRFTYSPSALGYSEAVLCAAHLCRPSHFLLGFAFTLSIWYWWWQRRIHLYL